MSHRQSSFDPYETLARQLGLDLLEDVYPFSGRDAALHLRRAGELLLRGAKVNICSPEGWSALAIAAAAGDVEMASLLIEHGADFSTGTVSPLVAAARAGKLEAVADLIKRFPEATRQVDSAGRPVLHQVVLSSWVTPEVCLALIEAGVDEFACDAEERNAWDLVLEKGREADERAAEPAPFDPWSLLAPQAGSLAANLSGAAETPSQRLRAFAEGRLLRAAVATATPAADGEQPAEDSAPRRRILKV